MEIDSASTNSVSPRDSHYCYVFRKYFVLDIIIRTAGRREWVNHGPLIARHFVARNHWKGFNEAERSVFTVTVEFVE